jgi:hypothetical protein
MNVDRDKLPRLAIGLKGEGRVGYCLRKINLTEDAPGLACKSLSIPGNAFFERYHIYSSRLSTRRYLRRFICQACLNDAVDPVALIGS